MFASIREKLKGWKTIIWARALTIGGLIAGIVLPLLQAINGDQIGVFIPPKYTPFIPLIVSVIGTCLGLNIIAGDQYIADVLPARTYRLEFQRRGIQPQVLSRTIDDTGTVTSPLVPWNSCGAYMSGTLGVSTIAYFPYCFFNLLNPLISLLYGLTGFQVKRIDQPADASSDVDSAPGIDSHQPNLDDEDLRKTA